MATSYMASPYLAFHGRRFGEVQSRCVITPMLLPTEVRDVVAPNVPMAKLTFNHAAAHDHVWNWRAHLGVDDRVIVAQRCDPTDILFAGTIADVHWRFATVEHAVITAVGDAARLDHDREYLIYGRWVLAKNMEWMHYTGIPCRFNAGARPNRSAEGSYEGGCGFTADGAAGAGWWRAIDAIEYLLATYNKTQAIMVNPVFTPVQRAASPIIPDTPVDGLSLWKALGRLAELGGLTIYSEPSADPKEPAGAIRVVRDSGVWLFDHQAPRGSQLVAMDTAKTNLFAASVAETTASCVTAPVVVGGQSLYEITIELGQAWRQDWYAVDAKGIIPPGSENGNLTAQYVKRYCADGDQFTGYQYVGRLWDANTDNKFPGLAIPDVATLAGELADTWPAMPYKPLRMLTSATELPTASGQERVVEFSIDNGATWWPLTTGVRVLPDRLGVYLTVRNLASIVQPNGDPLSVSLAAKLLTAAAKVKLRLTCSIASPNRIVATPETRADAGTIFPTSALFDRGSLAQCRKRAASSQLAKSGLKADETDAVVQKAALATVAATIQDHNERRLAEASLVVEWVASGVPLGGVVTKIGGIEVDLSTNSGAARTYPRIVGRIFRLDPETYQTEFVLDTDREMGVV